MARKTKWETHVLPHLDDITKWIPDYTEGQIAKKLGITQATFDTYKRKYPELKEAIIKGEQSLVEELHETMKRKAKGYKYIETKIIDDEKNGRRIETYEKYAQPDTGAIHLLLKNYDPKWHNDDMSTIKFKEKQQELDREKLEMQKW